MRFTELHPLMHAVLDGEATPAEAAELERQLAASPAARAEFEQLRHLFDDLAGVPARHPPEGLVASVQAALGGIPLSGEPASQLSTAFRVLAGHPGAIRMQADSPLRQQDQPIPPPRSLTMTQPHPPYSAKRKAMVGGGLAIVAALIVWQFGFDSTIRSEDVAGTVVPAQRYRAPQGAAEIKLGDQSMAQLMQNDAFVKLIRDPQIQALAREPGFVEAARILQANPEAARVMIEHAEATKKALASPEMLRAMEYNAEAARAVERAAAAAIVLQASPEAQKLLAENRALDRYVTYLASMDKTAAFRQMDRMEASRVVALNAEQAQRFAEQSAAMEKTVNLQALEKRAAESAALERYMSASADASRMAEKYAGAAKALAAYPEAAQLIAMNAEAARVLMLNPEAARMLAQSPEAMRALLAFPDATRAMLAAPEASRALLQNPEAARLALQAAAAERNVDRAHK
jgi:hypothetical protein